MREFATRGKPRLQAVGIDSLPALERRRGLDADRGDADTSLAVFWGAYLGAVSLALLALLS